MTVNRPTLFGPESTERLLKSREVEVLLGVAKGFLAKDRVGSARIPYVKISRAVRYRATDVWAFINANMRENTSDKPTPPRSLQAEGSK